jgi:predicted nuclease with TOPRIM domain
MMIWKKLKSVSESDKQERLATVEKTNAELEARVSTLEKTVKQIEDQLAELEFNHKEDLEHAAEFIPKQLQERLAILEAQANRVDNLATSTSTNSASKDELVCLVNALASALANIQDRMNLPF